jgi:hypothetical protein
MNIRGMTLSISIFGAIACSGPLVASPPVTTFQTSGVKIEVTQPQQGASDEEVARALEEAAAKLRVRSRSGDRDVLPVAASGPIHATADPAPAANLPGSLPFLPCPVPTGEVTNGDAVPNGFEDAPWYWVLLPKNLLWEPPVANKLSPQMVFLRNGERNSTTIRTIDTAIGGTVPLVGYMDGNCSGDGIQLDFFGVVLSRFSDDADFVAADYRFGLPITFQDGPWTGKIGYEHTSTHLGDDFIRLTNDAGHPQFKVLHVRDEVVLGLAYNFTDHWKMYGQFGYSPHLSVMTGHNKPARFDWGVEYRGLQPTGCRGEPFAALDIDSRGDEGYNLNVTGQVGWHWVGRERRNDWRVFLEGYDGHSPYGQFFLNREKYVGAGFALGF